MKRQVLIADLKESVNKNVRLVANDDSVSLVSEPEFEIAGYGSRTRPILVKQFKSYDLQLLKEIDAAREDERRRLSRELHDQLGQDLVALSLGLRSLRKSAAYDSITGSQIDELQGLVDQLGMHVHEIAMTLRPTILDDLGLQMALTSLAEQWSLNTGIEVNCRISGLENQYIPKPVETTIYRVSQEALTNVYKHAKADNVDLTLNRDGRNLVVVISDDGKGIDFEALNKASGLSHGLGLTGMRERVTLVNGTLKIKSSPNKGTSIIMNIPLLS